MRPSRLSKLIQLSINPDGSPDLLWHDPPRRLCQICRRVFLSRKYFLRVNFCPYFIKFILLYYCKKHFFISRTSILRTKTFVLLPNCHQSSLPWRPCQFRSLCPHILCESRMFATKHPAFCYQALSLRRKNIVFSRLSAGLFFPARGLVLWP